MTYPNNPLKPNKKKGVWQYQEAKAKLSEVMNHVQEEGIQWIIRNRTEIFVVLSKNKFDEFIQPRNSLIEFFKSAPYPDTDLDLERNRDLPREIDL